MALQVGIEIHLDFRLYDWHDRCELPRERGGIVVQDGCGGSCQQAGGVRLGAVGNDAHRCISLPCEPGAEIFGEDDYLLDLSLFEDCIYFIKRGEMKLD